MNTVNLNAHLHLSLVSYSKYFIYRNHVGFFSCESGNVWSVEETGLICHYCFRPVHSINSSLSLPFFIALLIHKLLVFKLKLKVNSELDVED